MIRANVRVRHGDFFPASRATDETFELGQIGFLIALRKRIIDAGAPVALICGPRHRRLVTIVGRNHAAVAKCFDPLIIAVYAAAIDVDAASHSTGKQQVGDDIVVIIQGTDVADETAGERTEVRGCLADDLSHDVQVVDHAIVKDASRDTNVVWRWHRVVTRHGAHELQPPDIAGAYGANQRGERRIEAPLKSDEQRRSRLVRFLVAGVDLLQLTTERLFRQRGLACVQARHHRLEMRIRRRRDDHRIRLIQRVLGAAGQMTVILLRNSFALPPIGVEDG